MREVIHDIFESSLADAICITTNGIIKANGELVMGAGLAKKAKEKYPHLPKALGKVVSMHGNHVYYVKKQLEPLYICSFPTKHDWRDKSDINLVIQSAKELVVLTTKMGWTRVYLTRPGCGLGGLDWQEIKPMLNQIFDDRFIICTPLHFYFSCCTSNLRIKN